MAAVPGLNFHRDPPVRGPLAIRGQVQVLSGTNEAVVTGLTPAAFDPSALSLLLGQEGPAGLDGRDGDSGPPGATGATGPVGPPGAQGAAGAQGFDGQDGRDGDAGAIGATGAPGPQGFTGAKGLDGLDGVDGQDGPAGIDGQPGPTGPVGPTGASGASGANGQNGLDGADGQDGRDGDMGLPGATGAIGPTGPQGTAGLNGQPGLDGADGLDGRDGDAGVPGATGPTGPAGLDGSQGYDGRDGEDQIFGNIPIYPFWQVLQLGNRSGAFNTFWDVGQFINFGLDGPTASNPQIRCGDALFRIRGTNVVSIGAGTFATVFSASGTTVAADGGTLVLQTALANRVVIDGTGEWTTPAGALGNVLTHQGAGLPPIWAAGGAGATGPMGPPGMDGVDGRDGDVGPPGATGATGATGPAGGGGGGGGGGGSILGVVSVNFGSTAQTSGTFDITGLSGLTLNDPVALSLAVDVADPTESEQSCVISGIVVGTSTIRCYWNAIDVMQGTRKVQYLIASSASSLTLSEGQMVGLPITHSGPGTNGPGVPISGATAGENIRYSTTIADAAISGSVLSYQVREPVTCLIIDAPDFFIWRSALLSGVGGGTAIAQTGRQIIVQLSGSSAPVLLKHEDAGESTQQRRFLCPGSRDYLIRPKESVILHRDLINSASAERVRVMPFQKYESVLWERQDFDMPTVGITNSTTSLLYNGTVHNYWQCISNTATASHGSVTQGGLTTAHKGIAHILTGASSGDIMSLYLTGTPGAGQNPASANIDSSKFVRADFWIKLGAISDSRIVLVGLGQDALSSTFGAESMYFIYNTAVSGLWNVVTRTGGVSTSVGTIVSAQATAWTKLSIERIFASSSATNGILFSIDDVPLVYNTTNITTAVLNAAVEINTQSAATKFVDVDRIDISVTEEFMIG